MQENNPVDDDDSFERSSVVSLNDTANRKNTIALVNMMESIFMAELLNVIQTQK